jgi:hypothetical protein
MKKEIRREAERGQRARGWSIRDCWCLIDCAFGPLSALRGRVELICCRKPITSDLQLNSSIVPSEAGPPLCAKAQAPASGTGTSAAPWLAASHPLKHQVLQQLRSSRTTQRYATPSLSIAPPLAGIDIDLIHSPSPSPAAHRLAAHLSVPDSANLRSTASLALGSVIRFSHGWRWPVQYVLSALSLPLARRSCTAHKEKKDRIASALAIRRHSSARPPTSYRLSTCIFIPGCIPRFPSSFAPERRILAYLLFDCYCCRLPNCLSVRLSAAGT